MYKDPSSYEKSPSTVSAPSSAGDSAIKNAKKAGYLLGTGRQVICKKASIELKGTINPTAKIIMETANTFVKGYLHEFTNQETGVAAPSGVAAGDASFSEDKYNEIKKIGAAQATVIKNHWINLYKDVEPNKGDVNLEEKLRGGKKRVYQRTKYTGLLEKGARIQETGWKQSNRDNTCALNTTLLYYVANKQLPGIFWINTIASESEPLLVKTNVKATDEASFVKTGTVELESSNFRDIVTLEKKSKLTRPVLNAIFNFLGASVMVFPSMYCNYALPTINEKVTYGTQINTIASYFPYSPIITCVETRGRSGHYGYQRNMYKLDKARVDIGDNAWFFPSFKKLFNKEEYDDDYFSDPKNAHLDGNKILPVNASSLYDLATPTIYKEEELGKEENYYLTSQEWETEQDEE